MGLRRFSESEITLSEEEAKQALVFFFGGNAHVNQVSIGLQQREFAQSLLYEALRRSSEWGFAMAFMRASMNPTLKNIMTKLAKEAWTQFKNSDDFKKDPKIYTKVKEEIARRWTTKWLYFVHGGELEWD